MFTHENARLACLPGSACKNLRTQIRVITLQKRTRFTWVVYHLVQRTTPMSQTMQIPDAKAAVEKEWYGLSNLPASQESRVKSPKRRRPADTVHFTTLMGLCHHRKLVDNMLSHIPPLWKMTQGRILCSPSRDLPRLSWQLSKFWRWSPDSQDARKKQVMQYRLTPRWKWKTLQSHLNSSTMIPSPKIMGQKSRYRGPALEKFCTGHPLAGLRWKRHVEKVVIENGREKSRIWNVCSCTAKRACFFSPCMCGIGRKERHPDVYVGQME